jgi:hypothetical protein
MVEGENTERISHAGDDDEDLAHLLMAACACCLMCQSCFLDLCRSMCHHHLRAILAHSYMQANSRLTEELEQISRAEDAQPPR